MPVVTVIAVALFASTPFASGAKAPASAPSIPPMIVNVTARPGASPALVEGILAEAAAIWRPRGVTFVWQRAVRVVPPYSRTGDTGPYGPAKLRLIIGDNRGPECDGRLAPGWICSTMWRRRSRRSTCRTRTRCR